MCPGNPNNPLTQVGNEDRKGVPPVAPSPSVNDTLVSNAKNRYFTWLMGMAISFIPIVVLPFYLCITGEINNISGFLEKVFYQSDILYMVISLAISAHNDASDNLPSDFLQGWKKIIWILIILGAVIFGILTIAENTVSNYPNTFVLWFNVVFFIINLIVGSVPYITSIIDAKRIAKGGV